MLAFLAVDRSRSGRLVGPETAGARLHGFPIGVGASSGQEAVDAIVTAGIIVLADSREGGEDVLLLLQRGSWELRAVIGA